MLKSNSSLHHANLLVGGKEDARAFLVEFLRELNFEVSNNPDFFHFATDKFGIDEARELKSLAAHKALGERKVFLLTPSYLTVEAQNALLKTFEDPVVGTHFFVVVRESRILLPTLLSRMQTIVVPRSGAKTGAAEKFLSMSLKDRLNFAKKFVDDELNLVEFMDDLLLVLKQNMEMVSMGKIFKLRKMMRNNPPAPRLALEHLSLVL